jgi:putative tryptophan/tyrosine transport system substrate-binding protein
MQFDHLKRRDFITLLGGAAAGAWPLSTRAQQPAVPVIGYLSARSPDDTAHLVAAFRRGLGEQGFVEGQNVTIEYQWALGQYDRLPAMATELVRRPVIVLATTGGEPSALAAKAATSTIPIVFSIGGDPVKHGLAASLNRPGGNATGVSLLITSVETKFLGLLHELVPQATTVGFLLNPSLPQSGSQISDVREAARTLNLQVHILRAGTDREIESAFESVAPQNIQALAVSADGFFDTRREKLVALAARHAVPTIYHFREFAVAGGLVSYGIDASDAYRLVGVYTGRVLKGDKPADLPVVQSTKFQLVINLKTAKALRLEIPDKLLALADEVIE